MSTLFDLTLSLAGPGSRYNVHSCIVGSALRDALLLNNVSSNMHYDVHLGLGPDLYKQYKAHNWVQLSYASYNSATDTSDSGVFHVSRNPLDSEGDIASVRGGPLQGDNIRVYVRPTTHKTASGFMRNTIKGVATSADEVALDLESRKIVMSNKWITGHNTKSITVTSVVPPPSLLEKYSDWDISLPVLKATSPLSWTASSSRSSSGHSPLITSVRPDPAELTFWTDEVYKGVFENTTESWKKDE